MNRVTGSHQALRVLGLEKVAKKLYVDAQGKKVPFWDSVKSHTSRQLIGDPRQYYKEVSDGTWKNRGSYVRNSFWPSIPVGKNAGPLAKILSHSIPMLYYLPAAMSLYAATKAPSEVAGQAYGNAAGSLVGSVLGAPLGILGASFGALGGGQLGESVSRMLSPSRPETSYYDASEYVPVPKRVGNLGAVAPAL